MQRSKLWLIMLSAIGIFLFAGSALADKIKLNNDDILTGEVVRKNDKVLELNTSYAGKMSIA